MVAEVVLGMEVVVAMAAMVAVVVALEALQGQEPLDLIPVKMVKINPHKLQIP